MFHTAERSHSVLNAREGSSLWDSSLGTPQHTSLCDLQPRRLSEEALLNTLMSVLAARHAARQSLVHAVNQPRRPFASSATRVIDVVAVPFQPKSVTAHQQVPNYTAW